MKYLENCFDELTSFEWLEQAYRDARRGKRYREEVLLFSENVDVKLLEIQEQLRSGTFVFGPYRRHWVYIPKKRRVMALPFESRVVQWAIYSEINPFFDDLMIEDSYGCRIGRFQKDKDGHYIGAGSNQAKGSLAAAFRLQYWLREAGKKGTWYVLKLDISKYFYRIDHDVLKRILRERIKDERLLALLDQIIDADEPFGLPRGMSADDVPENEWLHDVGVPIGNLTSQLFANIYLNELDQFAKHQLHIHRYIRYMDDIVVVAESLEDAHVYLDEIRRFLEIELKLELNRKVAITPASIKVEFVGYIVTARDIKLRKTTARRIKRVFRSICTQLAAGKMTREEFDRRVASYNGMLEPCSADNLRRRLNEIYTERVVRHPDPRRPLRPMRDAGPDD